MTLTPPAIIRKLTLATTKGGKQGELEYRAFHVAAETQPLKRKYTKVE